MEPSERLAEIAALIKAGADPESFKNEIDKLLGTEVAERDEIADSVWEDEYRGWGNEGN